LSPRFLSAQDLPSIGSSQASFIGHHFNNFQLQQPMGGQDPLWNGVLLSIVDDQTHNI
jgi:hypothetical protein